MRTIRPGDNHPLTRAKWIWPEAFMYLYNHYAEFRKDFTLPAKPRKAPFYITADRNYKLYVNGVFASRGPARGYQSHWPFDEVDLAPYLRAGQNWISIEAYNPGVSNFQYLHQSWAGMICAGKFGKFELLSDKSWLMRRSPARRADTARYSLQLDFQEVFDARRENREWITSAQAPQDWNPVMFPHGQNFHECSFGRPPWDSVEERGIPLLRDGFETPQAPGWITSGTNAPGYADRSNISWDWMAEMQDRVWRQESVRSDETNGWREFTAAAVPAGEFRAYALNFDRSYVGNLLVEVEGAEGGEILDFQHEQYIPDGKPYYRVPGNACHMASANRLFAAPGKTSHEFFSILTTGNLTVVLRDAPRPLTIRVRLRTAVYPFSMRGSFCCGEELLNRIHASARHCQQICSLDAYVDTPWREQAQWWGDARVQAKNTFYLDGDARLLARGIRSIAGQSTAEGLTYGHAPTVANSCILPDFSLTWIMTIWDYYWQTGEIKLFQEQWPRIQQVLGYFDQPVVRAKNGLLRHDRRFWYFGDWAPLFKGELPTLLNLYYLQALDHLAILLKTARMAKEAKDLATRAKKQRELVLKHLYDRKNMLFYGGLDEKGKPAKEYSVHDQVMAILLDLAPEAHENMVQKKLLPALRGENTGGAEPSAFWVTYLFEVMGERGYHREVVDFIRRKWKTSTLTHSTWEGYPPEVLEDLGKMGGTQCHAWSAHPCFHLVNLLAGIRQTAPGWKSVSICPALLPECGPVRALVPTPMGDITFCSTEQGGKTAVEVVLPAGVRAEVRLPGVREKLTGKKRQRYLLS